LIGLNNWIVNASSLRSTVHFNAMDVMAMQIEQILVAMLHLVEINRAQIDILTWLSYKSDCLKNKERERQAYIYGKEETILGEAEYQIRSSMPSITHEAKPAPQRSQKNATRSWDKTWEHSANSRYNSAYENEGPYEETEKDEDSERKAK
jgi:hypothetical protein